MALQRFQIRGGDDWLLFAARVDAPDLAEITRHVETWRVEGAR